MKPTKIIVFVALLTIAPAACKDKVEDNQPIRYNGLSFDEARYLHNYDTTTVTQTLDSAKQQEVSGAVVHSSTTFKSDRPNRHGYAERKKTDELEEEYYDAFGDNYLYDIDDEEYEAGEQEYDYDD